MKNLNNPALKAALERLYTIDKDDDAPLEKRLNATLKVRAACIAAGVPYAFASWRLCIVLDNMNDLLPALDAVNEAIAQDPTEPNYHRSYDIIVARVKDKVIFASTDELPLALDCYQALSREGETNEATTLHLAELLTDAGQKEAAFRLADALCITSPHLAEALALRNALADELQLKPSAPAVTLPAGTPPRRLDALTAEKLRPASA